MELGEPGELSVFYRKFVKLDESGESSILFWKHAGLDGLCSSLICVGNLVDNKTWRNSMDTCIFVFSFIFFLDWWDNVTVHSCSGDMQNVMSRVN